MNLYKFESLGDYTGIIKWYDDKELTVFYSEVHYVNGYPHKEDGPAITTVDGASEWCLKGISYSKERWFDNLEPEQKIKSLFNPENW
jgi:hypothetical protein